MILPIGDDPETAAIRSSLARKGLAVVHPRKAEVLRLYYLDGLNDAEIGQNLGVSTARAQQLRVVGLRVAREKLVWEGRAEIGCASIYF